MINSLENIKEAYESKVPQYNKLGVNLTEAIEILLEKHSIQYLKVYNRTKAIDSFIDKIDRKGYSSPFEQTEDMCGLRIICYYGSDMEKICNIIRKEFDVVDSQSKGELLNPDQFGYRSHHFVVTIKEDWLSTPNYNGLGNLKAEIQIRTNLMHTWAEIEHELGYKKEEDIPDKFKRRFSRLSAKLEEADDQFEELKRDIKQYRKEKRQESEEGKLLSISSEEINVDILQIFFDTYFPERRKIIKDVNADLMSNLLAELKHFKVDFKSLLKWHEKTKDKMPLIELAQEEPLKRKPNWNQIGYTRVLMMLHVEGYMEHQGYAEDFKEAMQKIKAELF